MIDSLLESFLTSSHEPMLTERKKHLVSHTLAEINAPPPRRASTNFSTSSTATNSRKSSASQQRQQEQESAEFTAPYLKYYQRLLTVNLRGWDILKRYNLWLPTVRPDFQNILLSNRTPPSNNINQSEKIGEMDMVERMQEKTNPLFIGGANYVPEQYDTYAGSSLVTSLFSELKLPAFTYHCSVNINDSIYILGGLIPCYQYDEEAPNLHDFVVDPIKNLPPPILEEIINDPSMISNPYLYFTNLSSNHLSKPEISGHIPPPLICAQGSKLTERHIFFYGGFELKTESTYDNEGRFYLKKSVFLNNDGYILDTMTFKFTKVEIISQQQSSTSTLSSVSTAKKAMPSMKHPTGSSHNNVYSNMPPRFGHILFSTNEIPSSVDDSNFSASHSYSILVFGGYTQTTDDKYIAMNDLWKIEVPVQMRGKRGYCKFADTAMATLITKENCKDEWPCERGFVSVCSIDKSILESYNFETELLENLEKNFRIEDEDDTTTNTDSKIESKNLSKRLFFNTKKDVSSSCLLYTSRCV